MIHLRGLTENEAVELVHSCCFPCCASSSSSQAGATTQSDDSQAEIYDRPRSKLGGCMSCSVGFLQYVSFLFAALAECGLGLRVCCAGLCLAACCRRQRASADAPGSSTRRSSHFVPVSDHRNERNPQGKIVGATRRNRFTFGREESRNLHTDQLPASGAAAASATAQTGSPASVPPLEDPKSGLHAMRVLGTGAVVGGSGAARKAAVSSQKQSGKRDSTTKGMISAMQGAFYSDSGPGSGQHAENVEELHIPAVSRLSTPGKRN